MPVCMNNTYGLVQLTTRQGLQLLSPVVLHSQDLYNTNKDVEHIKLEANCLLHGITRDNTALSEASMMEDLLRIVEHKATKDSEATI